VLPSTSYFTLIGFSHNGPNRPRAVILATASRRKGNNMEAPAFSTYSSMDMFS